MEGVADSTAQVLRPGFDFSQNACLVTSCLNEFGTQHALQLTFGVNDDDCESGNRASGIAVSVFSCTHLGHL